MSDRDSNSSNGPVAVRDLTGTTVGRFAVRARLGAGGMGEVYRAEDTKLKRPVALKRVAPELATDPGYRSRFLREAERASSLAHEHIAAVYDVLEESGEIFLVMEFVEGQTLRQRMREPFTEQEFLELAIQCAEALVAAHARGIVHRDIKPENIMVTPAGKVKILDFGVARRILQKGADAATETSDSTTGLIGTPAYMAPEVLLEQEADGRADIFSLGVVLYEMLARRHPFRAASFVGTSSRILNEEPPPLSKFNPAASPELERILGKMMAKKRGERHATAADLICELRSCPALPARHPSQKLVGRRAWLLVAVAAAALSVVGAWRYLRDRANVFVEREWILVSDFENRSGEPLFDQTVTELVKNALLQSRYINVVSRAQALEAAQRTGRDRVEEVDAALGREICQRENYRALLTGKIERADQGFLITVAVQDPWRGTSVFSDGETFREPAAAYAAIDRLALQIRQRLGESLAQIEKSSEPLERVTTRDLDALQRYSRAVRAYEQGNLQKCIDLATTAVERDPDFAMAHLYLANAHLVRGNLTETSRHLQQAVQAIDHVSERERLVILGTYFSVLGQNEKAADHYRKLTELYPDDIQGHRGLAEASIWIGRLEDAIASDRRCVELGRHNALDVARLLLHLVRASRFGEAIREYQEATAKGAQGSRLLWGVGLAHFGQGDTDTARRVFGELAKSGGDYEENLGQLYLSKVLIFEGRLAEASEALRTGLVLDEKMKSESWAPVRGFMLAKTELIRDRKMEARRRIGQLAGAALEDSTSTNPQRVGLIACQMGELAVAAKILGKLDALQRERESAYAKSSYYNLRGALALRSGRPAEAIQDQRTASAYFPSFETYTALGEAHQAAGEWLAAAEAFEKSLTFKGETLGWAFPADWVLGHLRLARVYARAGQPGRAIVHYDEFLKLWARADSGLRPLLEARAERDALLAASKAGLGPSTGNQ